MIKKIVSGGQTGVDRAALDAAIELNIPYGGYCPRGRLSEDGTIPAKYKKLKETDSEDYSVRTILNIEKSDGTLVIVAKTPIRVSDGTILTIEEATRKNKPLKVIDLSQAQDISEVIEWINENHIEILNVAGPRASQSEGIYEGSLGFLLGIFKQILSVGTDFPRPKL